MISYEQPPIRGSLPSPTWKRNEHAKGVLIRVPCPTHQALLEAMPDVLEDLLALVQVDVRSAVPLVDVRRELGPNHRGDRDRHELRSSQSRLRSAARHQNLFEFVLGHLHVLAQQVKAIFMKWVPRLLKDLNEVMRVFVWIYRLTFDFDCDVLVDAEVTKSVVVLVPRDRGCREVELLLKEAREDVESLLLLAR